jgi:hypothetical protein
MNVHEKDNGVQDNGFVNECKVTVSESGYEITGNFYAMIPLDINHEHADNELDRIEQHTGQPGQQFKRVLRRLTFENDEKIKAKH